MRRPILRASPAALRRAAEMYRPFDGPRLPIAAPAKADDRRPALDLADVQPVKREDDSTIQTK